MVRLRVSQRILGKGLPVLCGATVVLGCGTTNSAGIRSEAEGSTPRARVQGPEQRWSRQPCRMPAG